MALDLGRGKLGISSTVIAIITAAAIWWLNDGPGAGQDPADPQETPSATAAPSDVSSEEPSEEPSTEPTEEPTQEASETPSEPTASTTPDGGGEDMPATDPHSGLPYVALDQLPPEAHDTIALIDAGGPFPYDADDEPFGNYEGLLPEPGDYLEYTVETPGLDHRGARRIVASTDGTLYWTEDHYESFEVIWR